MYRKFNVSEIGTSSAGQGAYYPTFDTSIINSSTLPPNLNLGEVFELSGQISSGGGNAFQVVKAYETLAAGQLVTNAGAAFGQVSGTVTSASSDTVTITTNITTVAHDVGQPLLLYIRNTTSSGGGNVLRTARLASGGSGAYGTNSVFTIETVDYSVASKPYGPNALTLAATNGDVAVLIRPFVASINTATTVPSGVALGVATAGNYTIVQVAGEALVLSGGTTPGLVIGELAVGGAAGVITASTTGAAIWAGASSIVSHCTYNTSASILVPCKVNFLGNL